MACKKTTSLSLCDKILIASIFLGMLITIVMATTLLRRDLWRYHHAITSSRHAMEDQRKDMERGEYREIDCYVDTVEDLHEDVECTQNEDGEWRKRSPYEEEPPIPAGAHHFPAEEEPPIPAGAHHFPAEEEPAKHTRQKRTWHGRKSSSHHGSHESPSERHTDGEEHEEWPDHDGSSGGERHRRPGGRHSKGSDSFEEEHHRLSQERRLEKKRHFECWVVRVSFTRHGGKSMNHAQAYENTTTMVNFHGCSFSRCGGDEALNRAELEELVKLYLSHKSGHTPARCYVNKDNPNKVMLKRTCREEDYRGLCKLPGVQATFWPFVLAFICACILIIRRLCMCCCCSSVKNANPAAKKVIPDKCRVTGQAYVVSPPPPSVRLQKEREAFSLSPDGEAPPYAPTMPQGNFQQLVLPSYMDAVKMPVSLEVLPPIDCEKKVPPTDYIPDVE